MQQKNKTNRDAHVQSGMEDCHHAALDHFEEVAAGNVDTEG